MQKIREKDAYEGNPVGLTEETCRKVSEHLDRHLASFIALYMQYHKHHWLVEGPQFRDLHLFLEENYNEIHHDFDDLAERMTLLGMTPTSRLGNFEKLSYIEQEPEGVFRIRDGLKNDMEAEKNICNELRKSIKVAFDHEDFGTKQLLEDILAKSEERAHHLEHFLGEDTLAVGMLHDPKEINTNSN